MTQLNKNVSTQERFLSVFGGAYLLFDTVANKKTNLLQTVTGAYLLLRGVTGFCLVYDRLGKKEVGFRAPNVNIRTSMIVDRPRDQVYAFWRRLENLPRFMKHLKKVEVLDDLRSEWTAALPGDVGALSWKSEIVKDDPGATLSWHSLPDSSIENAGKISFKDAGDSATEVDIVISYHAPMGVLGEKAGRVLNPVFESMVSEDVRNFKKHIESLTRQTTYR